MLNFNRIRHNLYLTNKGGLFQCCHPPTLQNAIQNAPTIYLSHFDYLQLYQGIGTLSFRFTSIESPKSHQPIINVPLWLRADQKNLTANQCFGAGK